MNILIAGASGLIGSALTRHFQARGDCVFELVRESQPSNPFSWQVSTNTITLDSSIKLDVVINLAGEASKGRWTKKKKLEIYNSRINCTKALTRAICELEVRPEVFISASAVGFYGETGSKPVTEENHVGNGFLAELSRDWESQTNAAIKCGVRVVNARFGLVLSSSGGALAEMLGPFKLGLGGRIGAGTQYWSWIGILELTKVIQFIIDKRSLSGPINLVSPNPATNAEFTSSLGRTINRPTLFAIPGVLVKLIFGEMGDAMLLTSTRVLPVKLQLAGYNFSQGTLDQTLKFLLGKN